MHSGKGMTSATQHLPHIRKSAKQEAKTSSWNGAGLEAWFPRDCDLAAVSLRLLLGSLEQFL